MLSRVNTLEEGKGGPQKRHRGKSQDQSALTSLHQRISELEKVVVMGWGRRGLSLHPISAPWTSGTRPLALASCTAQVGSVKSPELLHHFYLRFSS